MRRSFRSTAVILLSLSLFSCDQVTHFFDGKPQRSHAVKRVKSAKTADKKAPAQPSASTPSYTADAYIEHLTLADIALQNADEVSSDDLDIVQAYSAQAQSRKQMVAVLNYKTKDSADMRRVIAPVTPGKTKFPALLEIMTRLSPGYTLHDLSLGTATVAPGEVNLSEADGDQLRKTLREQQEALLASLQKLPLLEDARTQLKLIRFFMQHNFRDAAYLSTDNAKQLLAAASQDKAASAETVKTLSKELESLETQLHKTMPFKL